MAEELTAVLYPGLTVTATLMSGSTATAVGIAMTETPVAGFYVGTVPPGTPAGCYTVLMISAGEILSSGVLDWAGGDQIIGLLLEVWGRLGLDPAKPMTTGQTQITFGQIVMALTEAAGEVTVSRQ